MKPSKLLIATLATVMSASFGASAIAQEAKPAAKPAAAPAAPPPGTTGDDNVQYKAKTVYDFDDDTVEGDLQRPDGELIDSVRNVKHSSLIEIRKDFIPEMLKSLEDV